MTNIEYKSFVEATAHSAPKYWKEGIFPREEATHPVVGVTKQDAEAYCKWLSRNTGNRYRLPTEWEWEWAAAGPHGWRYPWGNQFEKDRCNTEESSAEGTTPVGSYLAGNSFCGASDMSGNVWEITLGAVGASLYLALSLAIVAVGILIASLVMVAAGILTTSLGIVELETSEALRGGAWYSPSDQATCFSRSDMTKTTFVGFRCVKEV